MYLFAISNKSPWSKSYDGGWRNTTIFHKSSDYNNSHWSMWKYDSFFFILSAEITSAKSPHILRILKPIVFDSKLYQRHERNRRHTLLFWSAVLFYVMSLGKLNYGSLLQWSISTFITTFYHSPAGVWLLFEFLHWTPSYSK